MSTTRRWVAAVGCVVGLSGSAAWGQSAFVNWENPHVHPLDMTPDGAKLLAVNTADARLEVFDISAGQPISLGSVPVGLDPVSVRARGNAEAWVVNHISDTVSIVDLNTLNVVRTLDTLDEPCDVVFAGTAGRAFVSCSQANTVQVFDPANLAVAPINLPIDGEDPRALATSPDGTKVYVAIFESGNRSTILGGGAMTTGTIVFPPNVVDDVDTPHGGVNPPPNDGAFFNPPINPVLPTPPKVGLIVKKNASEQWMDDNAGDWTEFVSGSLAGRSGRPAGWDLPDHDVAIIDAEGLGIEYVTGLMNICMAIAVNPFHADVTVVGTDGTNETRFEPVVNGRFIRVNFAQVLKDTSGGVVLRDLNSHLDYGTTSVSQTERDKSLGDPRGIAWTSLGTKAYVSGMGSNNVVVVDREGNRIGLAPTIEVGEGPTGLALDETRSRLYVLNKFAATISVVNTVTELEVDQVPLFDPSPSAIKIGRKHLYDTHKNSGLGHIACASCHVDARMDRLSWDLGNPAGTMEPFDQNCNFGAGGLIGAPACQPWHPMKGPMTTQTLQDIIAKEPLHWRGDRNGLEEFNGAFLGLQGDDVNLTPAEMQEYENFLATITFPPNPFRNFDNTLPTSLPLSGHFATGRFAASPGGLPAGAPLPNGNAATGLTSYRTAGLDQGINCVACHTLPTGMGSNLRLQGIQITPFPTGPNGELHHAIVSVDGSTNVSIKIPHLRNLYDKVGFEATQTLNRAGFGFLHDGSVDSIARFVSEPVFQVTSDQQVANLVAFMLAFAGSDLPIGSTSNLFELRGPTSKDSHAAVGTQVTFDGTNNSDATAVGLLNSMVAQANTGKVGLVAKGKQAGVQRGYAYTGANLLQSDRAFETTDVATLRLSAGNGAEVTFTVVPIGSQTRIGIDRDLDGALDRNEIEACSDPADAGSIPGSVVITGDGDRDGDTDLFDYAAFENCAGGPGVPVDLACKCSFDFNQDGDVDMADFAGLQLAFTNP